MAVSINTLTTAFAIITLGAPFVVAWRYRHRPAAAMIAAAARRESFHRDALAAIDATVAAAQAEGRSGEAERLIPARRGHIRALAGLDAARERTGGR